MNCLLKFLPKNLLIISTVLVKFVRRGSKAYINFRSEQSQYSAMAAVMFDPDDSKTLVTCGKEHINFWRLHNTRLERKNGYFEVL